jgi:hypothetical protein
MKFFQSKLGGPTHGQALGKKNKLREASGTPENYSFDYLGCVRKYIANPEKIYTEVH